jgi:hypothetical protein
MRVGPAVDTLARLDDPKPGMPVVISWPLGAGRGTYAGALDAWRYRASGDDYAKFWRGYVASAASSAPRRIETALEPGLAAPGDMVTLRVRVRETDFTVVGESIQIPVVSAVRTDSKGGAEPIRLWPTEETGAFEGRFEAPAPGHYVIRVASKEQAAFETPLIVADGARTAAPAATVSQRLLVEATGGVSASGGDLSALESHLSGVAGPSVVRSIHPARSPWLMAAFISLLCAEWGLRRRGGAR